LRGYRNLAAAGKSVMVISSELVELMAICDRILVMSHAHIRAGFTPNE
jgi:ABC-type sugar transport system ATPase subunit